MYIKDLQPGDTFSVAGNKWRLLSIDPLTQNALVESVESAFVSVFDSDGKNEWSKSSVSSELQSYLDTTLLREDPDLEHYIIQMHRDLTALEGGVEYGGCTDKITLLTARECTQLNKAFLPRLFSRLLITPSFALQGARIVYESDDGIIQCADSYAEFEIHPVLCLHPNTPVTRVRRYVNVEEEYIDRMIRTAAINVATVMDRCTVVTAKLANGFILVESSPCEYSSDYDRDIGIDICMRRIRDRLWEMEKYMKMRGVEQ